MKRKKFLAISFLLILVLCSLPSTKSKANSFPIPMCLPTAWDVCHHTLPGDSGGEVEIWVGEWWWIPL